MTGRPSAGAVGVSECSRLVELIVVTSQTSHVHLARRRTAVIVVTLVSLTDVPVRTRTIRDPAFYGISGMARHPLSTGMHRSIICSACHGEPNSVAESFGRVPVPVAHHENRREEVEAGCCGSDATH